MKLLLLLASLAFGQVTVGSFCGLNNTVPAASIEDCEAQEALNMEANRGGTTLRKRDGFTKLVEVSTNTRIHSLFIFQNDNGNDIFLTADKDGYLEKSQNLGTPTALSTITAGAYLNCSENEGKAWCFSSSNDQAFSFDGSLYTTEVDAGYPNGAFNVFTQNRHLVAGTTSFPNRLYISKAGDYDEFTTGLDEIDAWTEDIGRNGDKITMLAFVNGRVVVGKSNSIGGFNLTDQFNSVYYDIDSRVGIIDPQAYTVHDGMLYFKGSDNHFYVTNGGPGQIARLSGKIRRSIAAVLSGKNRQDIQTSKADWDAGNLTAAGLGAPIRSDITNGSIQGATVTLVDTSSTNFAAGTLSSLDAFSPVGDLKLSSTTVFDNFADGNFSSNPTWTCTTSGGCSVFGGALRIDLAGVDAYTASTISTGSWSYSNLTSNANAQSIFKFISNGTGLTDEGYAIFNSYDSDTSQMTISLRKYPGATSLCSGVESRAEGNFFTWVVERNDSGNFIVYNEDGEIVCTATDTDYNTSSHILVRGNINISHRWDDILAVSYSTTGVSTSRIYDTGVSSAVGGPLIVSSSVPNGSSLTFYVRASTASDGGGFNDWAAVTNGNKATLGRRYAQLRTIFNTSYSSQTPSIQSTSLAAATTGLYVTSCIEPGSGITSWGIVDIAGTQPGNSSLSYEIQTGADCSSLGGWTAISTGVALTVGTNPALKYRITYDVKSATEEARVDSITTRWTEGSVSPPSFVEYWNEAVYFSYSTGTVNNRVAKLDLVNPGIYIFELGMNSPFNYRDSLYFGSTDSAHISKFSDLDPDSAPTSDAGEAIDGYWRTKAFHDGNPFAETIWEKVSFIGRQEDGGDLDITWRLDGGAVSGTFAVDLGTGTNTVRHNEWLPTGQRGTFIDLEYRDNSTEPFEVLGTNIDGTPKPWRPLPNEDN